MLLNADNSSNLLYTLTHSPAGPRGEAFFEDLAGGDNLSAEQATISAYMAALLNSNTPWRGGKQVHMHACAPAGPNPGQGCVLLCQHIAVCGRLPRHL